MSDKIFSAQDLTVLLSIPILTAMAWIIPEQYWLKVSRRLGNLAIPALTDDPDLLRQRIQETWGEKAMSERFHLGGIALTSETILAEMVGEQIFAKLQLFKEYRPGGWNPAIQLVGREYIEEALHKGHGAILWVGYFTSGELVTKKALHQAGFAVHHLTLPSHGFSSSQFGMRYLNPIQTMIEERYLAERIVISPDNPTQAMLSLAYQLRENQIVSITVHRNAKKPTQVKFLDGTMYLAPGAPTLAHQTKAALLPVFPLRNEAGDWTVIVAPPLQVSEELRASKAVEIAAQQYATLLESYVLKFPSQWNGWLHL